MINLNLPWNMDRTLAYGIIEVVLDTGIERTPPPTPHFLGSTSQPRFCGL